MFNSLAGRTAVVTGASKGIGRGIARRLGEVGCSILVVARNKTESGHRWGGGTVAVRRPYRHWLALPPSIVLPPNASRLRLSHGHWLPWIEFARALGGSTSSAASCLAERSMVNHGAGAARTENPARVSPERI
jgi:short chain dehydrogenase